MISRINSIAFASTLLSACLQLAEGSPANCTAQMIALTDSFIKRYADARSPNRDELSKIRQWYNDFRILIGGNFPERPGIEVGISSVARAYEKTVTIWPFQTVRRPSPRILYHELGHLLLSDFLIQRARLRSLPLMEFERYDQLVQWLSEYRLADERAKLIWSSNSSSEAEMTGTAKEFEERRSDFSAKARPEIASLFAAVPEREFYFHSILTRTSGAYRSYVELFADSVVVLALSDWEAMTELHSELGRHDTERFRNFTLDYTTEEVIADAKTAFAGVESNGFHDTRIMGPDPHHIFAEVRSEIRRSLENKTLSTAQARIFLLGLAESIEEELLWVNSSADRTVYFRLKPDLLKEANLRLAHKVRILSSKFESLKGKTKRQTE